MLINIKINDLRYFAGLAARGQAWALLGVARLALVIPPPGNDPAASYAMSQQHTLRLVKWQIDPELEVRRQYNAAPGGPSERAAIAALIERKTHLEETAAHLEGKSPPRPSPPQYLALQEDIARFASGLASLPRMVEMVQGVAQGDVSAVQEARSWIDNAGAVVARVGAQYPGYRDIIQPVQLAIQEVRYGLALGVGAAEITARGTGSLLETAAQRLLAFPRQEGPFISLESLEVQRMVSNATAQAVKERAAAHGSSNADAAGYAAGTMARITLLRAAMHAAREEWLHAATPEAQSKAVARLHVIFNAFVIVWEDIKEEEARRAAEEAELFKTKSRTVGVPTEEEEAEEEFQNQYPDQFAAFEDLADPDDLLVEEDPDMAFKPKDEEKQESAAAAFSAKSYFLGEILNEVVSAHAEVFSGSTPFATVPSRKAFMRSYELGMHLVELAGGCLSAELDDATLTGHLYAAANRGRELVVQCTSEEADIHQPCPEEAVLVQAPLQAVRLHIGALLEEWPEHPVLMQLDAISDRILSMPVNSPLKALLTGLELLLARAQVWEETAAKHVSIATELKAVAALATRWRRLELTGWRFLVKKTVLRVESGAYMGWFHLYRILKREDTSVAEVAASVEQFVQGSPLGEYNARLSLLEAFRGQIIKSLEVETEDKQRNATLVSVIRNVCNYYSQFVPAVDAAVATGLAPHEKDLKDFVVLAKWEDRGYYAMKASTEKAQRHLHKLCRRAADALKAPATATLAIAAKSMGLDDLAAPESIGAAVIPGLKKHHQPPTGPATVAALVNSTACSSALAAAASKPSISVESLPEASGKYTKQLPELTTRFEKVVRRGLTFVEVDQDGLELPAIAVDEMASDVASRAVQLRGDIVKGAKARKKKALVDFFRALAASGVSKLRSAVPVSKRGVQAWFA